LRDLDTLRQFLSGPTPGTLFDLPWTPVFLAIIFLLHHWLGFFALGGAALLSILALLNDRMTRGPLQRAGESSAHSHRLAEESRRNAPVIQAMGMESAIQERWHGVHARALHDQTLASDRNGAFSAVAKALRLLMQSAILALGAYLAIHQEITAGAIIAASIIMARALAPIEQGISHWRGFLQYRSAKERLELVLLETTQGAPKMDLPAPKGRLSVEKLCVAAPGETAMLLQDISFTLEPGHALGVIGPSGAGKSSLARALANIWQPASGTVAMDRAPYDHWDANVLGRATGYLPQDVELFEGTVDENIARFDPERDAKSVIRAARLAGVHDMILRLPDGYKTRIGEAGAKLSAGQRQRIGLARALYGAPALIVLDEPNSNLDAVGEAALSRAILAEKQRGAAIVVIAHRQSAIAAADRLLYLADGRQMLIGPKEDVLRKVLDGGNAAPAPMRANAG
jgi:ATP-binding cassette subfamily C protein